MKQVISPNKIRNERNEVLNKRKIYRHDWCKLENYGTKKICRQCRNNLMVKDVKCSSKNETEKLKKKDLQVLNQIIINKV